MVIGVKRWAVAVGLGCVAASFAGWLVGSWVPSPDVPEPCRPSVGVYDSDDSVATCYGNCRLSFEKLEAGKVLVVCNPLNQATP